MDRLSPEHIGKIIELINESPYFKHLAMVVKELAPGCSLVELEMDQRHLNPFGPRRGDSVRP